MKYGQIIQNAFGYMHIFQSVVHLSISLSFKLDTRQRERNLHS
jgi:hypothetical protein